MSGYMTDQERRDYYLAERERAVKATAAKIRDRLTHHLVNLRLLLDRAEPNIPLALKVIAEIEDYIR